MITYGIHPQISHQRIISTNKHILSSGTYALKPSVQSNPSSRSPFHAIYIILFSTYKPLFFSQCILSRLFPSLYPSPSASFGRWLCLSAMLANTPLSIHLTMATITITTIITTITTAAAAAAAIIIITITMINLSIIALINNQMAYLRIPCTNNHHHQSILHHECLVWYFSPFSLTTSLLFSRS